MSMNPKIKGQKILNILVLVDSFKNTSHEWYKNKDLGEFSEEIIGHSISPQDFDILIFQIYSIEDKLSLVKKGSLVKLLIDEQHSKNIHLSIRKHLRVNNFDKAFKKLYRLTNDCLNGDNNACNIGTISSNWVTLFMIVFFGLFIIACTKGFLESRKKEKV